MSCHSASVRSEVYRIRSVLRECIYIVQTKIADFIDAFWVFKQALTHFFYRIPSAAKLAAATTAVRISSAAILSAIVCAKAEASATEVAAIILPFQFSLNWQFIS